LIELLVTLSIIVILLTIALPAMAEFVANIRLLTQANLLVGDILQARSEAATRGRRAVLCASTTVANAEPVCASGTASWTSGRIVFIDRNRNNQRDVGQEELLRKSAALESGATLTAANFGDTAHISFSPFGGLEPTTAGSFTLCSGVMASGYRVSIPATGQPQSAKVSCQ
jgi:type IV fimbrial biogenesis protein FimT